SHRKLRTICLTPYSARFQDRIWVKGFLLYRTLRFATALKTETLWYHTKGVFLGKKQGAPTIHYTKVDEVYARKLYRFLRSGYPFHA
ncbi:PIPO, partial [Oat mosaic virus]|uniref:PIPO n=1 Tax=Oat mosaic virus TaxID=157837 RepID=UPI000265130E